ncbi:MAG: ATP-binding protein [Myxococcales bacterium]
MIDIAMYRRRASISIAMLITELMHDMNPFWKDGKARLASEVPIRRELHDALLTHLATNPRRAAVLVGPRQVGKTTLLLQLADELVDRVGIAPANITYFNFSDPRLPLGGVPPGDVIGYKPAGVRGDQPRFFLFDEVSRGERWAEWLKHAVDATQGRFLVTDSASTLLREGGRESGLGRWDEYRIEGLSFREFIQLQPGNFESFEKKRAALPDPFARYLSLGGFPEHAVADSPSRSRRRIREDTVDRAIQRDLLRFDVDVERIRDLFVYLVGDSGAIFDARARARLLQRPEATPVDRRSLEKWIALLEDTRLIVRLDPFARAPAGKLAGRSYPKLYPCDHGLVVAFSGVADPLDDPSIFSRSLEATVFRHLRGTVDASHLGISYLRDAQGLDEIDFVIHEGATVRALVEVTVSKQPDKKLEQMIKLGRDFKAARTIIVHGGVEERKQGPVWFAPAPTFLLDTAEWTGVP